MDPGHVEDSRDVTSKLKACSGRFPEKSVLLEASRHPDPSYHQWVFLEPPIPAKAARFLGRRILERAGLYFDRWEALVAIPLEGCGFSLVPEVAIT